MRRHDKVMSEKLTVNEFFALFGRTPDLARWASSADSEEYLTLVTYLVGRANNGSAAII